MCFLTAYNINLNNTCITESSQLLAAQSELAKQHQSVATPESTFLAQLERDARCIAASVDGLTEHLAVSLHTVNNLIFILNKDQI